MVHRDYSATPLPKKLGIKEGSIVDVVGAPSGFRLELPEGARFASGRTGGLDVAVLFVTRRSELRRRFPQLVRRISKSGRLWVCWPKKSSGLNPDVSFDIVQRTGLEAGLVDNKSASITDLFQGLQFVYRLEDRR